MHLIFIITAQTDPTSLIRKWGPLGVRISWSGFSINVWNWDEKNRWRMCGRSYQEWLRSASWKGEAPVNSWGSVRV